MKKIISLILALTLVFCLCGCEGGNEAYPPLADRDIEERLTYSEVSEKVLKWKMLNELHELIWEITEECIDNNYYLIYEPQAIKLVAILEGIEEVIIDYGDGDDFHVLETSYIDELIIMLQDDYAVFKYVANRYAINNDYLELEQRIDQLQRQVDSLEILVEILSSDYYNEQAFTIYNEYFAYCILDDDTVTLKFKTDDNSVIYMYLFRDEVDGDFYYGNIILYGSDLWLVESFSDLDATTHYSDTAISLIQDIIEDSDWEYFISKTSEEVWEDLKAQLGVED
jgi:hypothetical protein